MKGRPPAVKSFFPPTTLIQTHYKFPYSLSCLWKTRNREGMIWNGCFFPSWQQATRERERRRERERERKKERKRERENKVIYVTDSWWEKEEIGKKGEESLISSSLPAATFFRGGRETGAKKNWTLSTELMHFFCLSRPNFSLAICCCQSQNLVELTAPNGATFFFARRRD